MKKLLLLSILLWSWAGNAQTTKLGKQSNAIMKTVKMWHYAPKPFDDDLSQYVFDEFIATVDPGGYYLLQSDIDALKKHEDQIDNEIIAKTSYFFKDLASIYKKRLKQADSIISDVIKKPFDFEKEEYLSYKEGDRKDYEDNLDDLRERWRKWLKYSTLEEIFESDYVADPSLASIEELMLVSDEALEYVVREERFEISSFLEASGRL